MKKATLPIEIEMAPPALGPFTFVMDNAELLRFDPDGAVFVRGEKVDDNRAIYEAVIAFFDHAQAIKTRNAIREALTEIAESFDTEARERADTEGIGVRQAEAAATYVRVVRDTKFPLPKKEKRDG